MDKVDICNMAIDLCGAQNISALTDSSASAELCNRFFQPNLGLCDQESYLAVRNYPLSINRRRDCPNL